MHIKLLILYPRDKTNFLPPPPWNLPALKALGYGVLKARRTKLEETPRSGDDQFLMF